MREALEKLGLGGRSPERKLTEVYSLDWMRKEGQAAFWGILVLGGSTPCSNLNSLIYEGKDSISDSRSNLVSLARFIGCQAKTLGRCLKNTFFRLFIFWSISS